MGFVRIMGIEFAGYVASRIKDVYIFVVFGMYVLYKFAFSSANGFIRVEYCTLPYVAIHLYHQV
jgi:hypothetical protein